MFLNFKKMKKSSAFSLIELSIVILIIGILIAGITQSSRLVDAFRIRNAQSVTQSSPVSSIKDLSLWLETSMESSFLESEANNDTAVSSWNDLNPQAINKNNATQDTAANRPKYIQNVINGIPALRFDGAASFMNFDGSSLIGSNYTIFVVEQRRAAGSALANHFIGGSSTSINANLHFGYYQNTTVRLGHYGHDLDYAIAGYSSPIPRIHTARFSTVDGMSYWLNGGVSADSSNSARTSAITSYNGAAIGRMLTGTSAAYFNGDIAEMIIFSRTLKTEERTSVEAYLAKKYSLKIS